MLEVVKQSRCSLCVEKFPARLYVIGLAVTLLLLSTAIVFAEDHERLPPRAGCPDLIDLIKELTPSVVNISIERHLLQSNAKETSAIVRSGQSAPGDGQFPGKDRFQMDSIGSGFICDTSGNIVTNAHVVEGAGKILVTFSTGKVVQARLVAVHPKVDLALINGTPPYPLQKAKIGDSSGVQVGEWVLAVGNPFGLGRTVTVGIVSGKGRFIGLGPDDDFIQTDASINPGNSGGPLFNMAGEVIGVNTAMIAAGKGIGFSIPANHISELLKAPVVSDQAFRGWLGIFVEDLTNEKASTLGLNVQSGTLVDEVLSSSPAQEAGLRKGDLILDAAGTPISNGSHLSKVIADSKPGDLMKMTVLRENRKRSVDVVIGRTPE
ncbi:MAG: trypsin-like peptidase domain-containing protein [Deltaproteobacteria bacterium]|nr:trypsin-like peptidase domain-containing protein [Deltaproteobacteria bacterium]